MISRICGNCSYFNGQTNACGVALPIYIAQIDNTTSINREAKNCKYFIWDRTKLKKCKICQGSGLIIEEDCNECRGDGGKWDDIADQWYPCSICLFCEQCDGVGYFNNE